MSDTQPASGQWRVIDQSGRVVETMALAAGLPPIAAVPGTLLCPRLGQWLMVIDVHYFLDPATGQWRFTGTLSLLPDPLPDEGKLYELRRHLLRHCGWL